MKRAALLALIGAVGAPLACSGPVEEPLAGPPADGTVPVLVELFTSEGCSSCPPADRLLSRLLAEQPVEGARIIALGEHVDYWNDLGWPDRFSSAAFTARQYDYGHSVFGGGAVYTPQVVVDGVVDAVGSNATAVRRAVQRAARTAKADVRVEAARVNAGETSVDVAVHLGALGTRDEPADVHLAVVENGLSTQVPRGENRGRTLTHDAVVRRNEVVATPEPGRRDLKAAQRVPIDEDWKAENVRIVAFLQERESRRVLGAASAKPVAVERARDAQ